MVFYLKHCTLGTVGPNSGGVGRRASTATAHVCTEVSASHVKGSAGRAAISSRCVSMRSSSAAQCGSQTLKRLWVCPCLSFHFLLCGAFLRTRSPTTLPLFQAAGLKSAAVTEAGLAARPKALRAPIDSGVACRLELPTWRHAWRGSIARVKHFCCLGPFCTTGI